jgi:hypothetical protein
LPRKKRSNSFTRTSKIDDLNKNWKSTDKRRGNFIPRLFSFTTFVQNCTFSSIWQLCGKGFCYRFGIGVPMRFIKTVILHLYFDPTDPDRLCGDLRPLETRDVYRFKDNTGLMRLLQKLSIPSKDGEPVNSDKSLPNKEFEK